MGLLAKALSRCRRFGVANSFRYAACRFATVRAAAKACYTFTKKRSSYPVGSSLFPDLSVADALRGLREDAFYPGLTLPEETVREIRAYADTAPCSAIVGEGRRVEFLARERAEAERRSGSKIVLAFFNDCAARCPALARIARDPKVLDIATRYMNKDPDNVDVRLWWSFVSDAPLETRLRSAQTVMYHYDLESWHFVYFSFYLTRCDAESGAHVLVRGSHTDKRLSHLLGSANRSDERILAEYGADRVITLAGEPGYGFVEDSFCYHKALAPLRADRLMLQVRMT